MLQNFSTTTGDLEQSISRLSVITVLTASVLLILLVIAAMRITKKPKSKLKAPVYISIVLVVASATFIISGATIYLNTNSATGGPVHWHADIEYWACGNELELRDPTGFLSNKIGTATLHEHDDKRIHLEGVPVELPHDASLGKFMEVIGGEISRSTMVVPLNDKDYFEDGEEEADGDGDGSPAPQLLTPFIKDGEDGKKAVFVNGQKCGDQPGEVQVFAYNYDEATKTYRQTKLDDPARYAITDDSNVPPGDCVIFEFGPKKDRTDKLCEQYGVRDKERCAIFGVEADKRSICELREVN